MDAMAEHEAEIGRIAAILNEAGVLDRRYIYTTLHPYSQKISVLGDTDNVKNVRVALDYMLVNEASHDRAPGLWPMWRSPEGVYPPYIDDPIVREQCLPVWAELAPLVHNDPVAARLHDALWISDERYQYGRDAIGYYRDSADAPVPDLATGYYLERAYYIAGRLNYKNVQHEIAAQAASILRRSIDEDVVRPNDSPGVFLPLLDLATAPAPYAVSGINQLIRDCYRLYGGDDRHKLSIIMNKKSVLPRLAPRLDRLAARIAFDHAKREHNALVRDSALREALMLDRLAGGHLSSEIMTLLQQPIDGVNFESISLETHVVDLSKYLGKGIVADFDYLSESVPNLPDENTIDVGLVGLFPVAVYDGHGYRMKTANDSESSTQHYRNQIINSMMYVTAAAIGEGVAWIIRRYKPSHGVLTNLLSSKGFLSGYHASVFAKTLLLFEEEKYDECAYISVPRIEGALRILAANSGIHIYKVDTERDTGGHMTLSALVKALKGQSSFREYARWFEAGLLGDNFRNDLAHDLREKEATNVDAARCVLLVILLRRLRAM